VHYAVLEFCDVDGVPGYQGMWPPGSPSDITQQVLAAIATKSSLQKDTFCGGGIWSETTFSSVMTSTNPPTATISSAASQGTPPVPFYTLSCYAGNSSTTVAGVTLGDFRFKCDVLLNPGPYEVGHSFPGSNITAAEALATTIGCGKANRKFALLGFLLGGASVGGVAPSPASSNWQSVAVGAAAFEAVNTFTVQFPNGTVVATDKAVMQIFDVSTLFPEHSVLPAWVATAAAVLTTFDVGRDVMNDDSMQIFWDPSYGFGGVDPSTFSASVLGAPAGSTNAAHATSISVALAVVALAFFAH